MNKFKASRLVQKRGSGGAYWQNKAKSAIANDLANWVAYQPADPNETQGSDNDNRNLEKLMRIIKKQSEVLELNDTNMRYR